jgi:hypothetical protein
MPTAEQCKQSLLKSLRNLVELLPVIIGMLLLTSLLITLLPQGVAAGLFGHGKGLDALLGALFGSIAAGHPLASYLLGGELLKSGVGLIAVTALIVSWVTVGVVQLPAEVVLLGSRFALLRNALCFVSALALALLCVYLLRLLGVA